MWAEVPFVLSQFTLLPYGHTDGWHLAHGYTAAAYLQHCKKSSKSCVFVLHCQILQFSGLNFHALQFEFHIPSFRPWFSRSVFSRLAIWSFIFIMSCIFSAPEESYFSYGLLLPGDVTNVDSGAAARDWCRLVHAAWCIRRAATIAAFFF